MQAVFSLIKWRITAGTRPETAVWDASVSVTGEPVRIAGSCKACGNHASEKTA